MLNAGPEYTLESVLERRCEHDEYLDGRYSDGDNDMVVIWIRLEWNRECVY